MASEEILKNIVLPESMPIYVALTAAVIQMVKQLPFFAQVKAYLPLVSIGIGLGLAYYAKVESWPIIGTMIGLTASGAYDLVKGKAPSTPGD